MYEQLSPLLKEYQIILEDYLPSKGTTFSDIPQYQRVFLDLATIHRKLMKSLSMLISVDDSEMDISIYAIGRSLTANTLTTYYFQSFIDENNKIDNESICNELRALNSEFIGKFDMEIYRLLHENDVEYSQKFADKYPDYFEIDKIKGRSDFHLSSNQSVIGAMNLRDGMLSEYKKMQVAIIKLSSMKNEIRRTFILNKLFTQYYHYNPVGGMWTRTSNINRSNEIVLAINYSINALIGSLQNLNILLSNTNEFIQYCEKLKKQIYSLVDKKIVMKYS